MPFAGSGPVGASTYHPVTEKQTHPTRHVHEGQWFQDAGVKRRGTWQQLGRADETDVGQVGKAMAQTGSGSLCSRSVYQSAPSLPEPDAGSGTTWQERPRVDQQRHSKGTEGDHASKAENDLGWVSKHTEGCVHVPVDDEAHLPWPVDREGHALSVRRNLRHDLR